MDLRGMNNSSALCKNVQGPKQEFKRSNGARYRMLKLMGVICLCLATFPLFGQPQPKYEVATIMAVQMHEDSPQDIASYDVTVKVGETIYQVLYTPPVDTNVIKYVAGRELLVLVGEKTITYNDVLGQAWEVPIVSRTSAAKDAK